MPRQAKLFSSSAGSVVRGYLKFRANITPRRIEGTFQMAAPFFDLSTANTGSAEPQTLALRIFNTGRCQVEHPGAIVAAISQNTGSVRT